MRKVFPVLICIALLATGAYAQKMNELNNPADFSNDFQFPAAAPGAVQFSDDFEGGTPPAGWSVVDNEGNGVIWANLAGCGEGGNYTNGSGDCACASSDVAGTADFDTELVTESYNFCDATNSTLSFTANYQNFANEDFFDVDYSLDGTAWTHVLSWNEDHGGFRAPPGEDVNLDVSVLDGESMVYFRFRYWDPAANDWEWYIQVDDYVLGADGTISVPGTDSCGGTGTPATNTTGLLILALVLLVGGSAYVLVRRSA